MNIAQIDRLKAMMLGLPIKRESQNVPLGYEPSKKYKNVLEPVQEELELIHKCTQLHKNGTSWQKLADWIQDKTGHRIAAHNLSALCKTRPVSVAIFLPLKEREKLFYERQDL